MPPKRTFTPVLDIDIAIFDLIGGKTVRQHELVESVLRALSVRGITRTPREVRNRIAKLVEKEQVLSPRKVRGRWLVAKASGVKVKLPERPSPTERFVPSQGLIEHWKRVREEFLPTMAKQIPQVGLDGVILAHLYRPGEVYTGRETETPFQFMHHPFYTCLGLHVPAERDPRPLWKKFGEHTRMYWDERRKLEETVRSYLEDVGWPVMEDASDHTATESAVNVILEIVQLAAQGSSLLKFYWRGEIPFRDVDKPPEDDEKPQKVRVPEEGDHWKLKVQGRVVLVGGGDYAAFEKESSKMWPRLVKWATDMVKGRGAMFVHWSKRLHNLRRDLLHRITECIYQESPTGPCGFAP